MGGGGGDLAADGAGGGAAGFVGALGGAEACWRIRCRILGWKVPARSQISITLRTFSRCSGGAWCSESVPT